MIMKHSPGYFLLFSAVAILFLTFYPPVAFGANGAGDINDIHREKIQYILQNHQFVTVESDAGHIAVFGLVRSPQERRAVLRQLRITSSVVSIQDKMGFYSPMGSGIHMADGIIASSIRGKIILHAMLSRLNIIVQTERGVVTLSGKAISMEQIALAEQLAWGTTGVKEVVNHIACP